MEAWYLIAKHADWKDFGSLKQTFGTADTVGNCVVFDVGNNRYRVIGRAFYNSHKLYILAVMDHEEYDKKLWIDGCNCHKPQPKTKPEHKKQRSRA